MTREAETVEKIARAIATSHYPDKTARQPRFMEGYMTKDAKAALSRIRAIVFEEVDTRERGIDGFLRPRTAAEIKAALIERLGGLKS